MWAQDIFNFTFTWTGNGLQTTYIGGRHNNQEFTTRDRDNDNLVGVNCAGRDGGAWGGTLAVTAPYWPEHILANTAGAATTDGFSYENPPWWSGGDSELTFRQIQDTWLSMWLLDVILLLRHNCATFWRAIWFWRHNCLLTSAVSGLWL